MGTTLAESLGRFYEGNARKRRTTMSAKRNKMTKDEETALFQKAMEAMRLFVIIRMSLKKGNLSEARTSLNASLDRRREGDRATADRNRIPSDEEKK